MCEAVRNPADRQFRRKCQMAVAVSLAVYVSCSQAALRVPSRPVGLFLAGLGGAAFAAELISVGLLVTRLRDEFQRALLVRSFVWATVVTMVLTTVWGFVEMRGRGQVPHLDVIWVPMLLVLATAVAKVIFFRQHRAEHE